MMRAASKFIVDYEYDEIEATEISRVILADENERAGNPRDDITRVMDGRGTSIPYLLRLARDHPDKHSSGATIRHLQ